MNKIGMVLLLLCGFAFSGSVKADEPQMNPDGYVGGWTLGADAAYTPSHTDAWKTSSLIKGPSGFQQKDSTDNSDYNSNFGLQLIMKHPFSSSFTLGASVTLNSSASDLSGSGTSVQSQPGFTDSNFTGSGNSNKQFSWISLGIGARWYFKP